MWNTFCCAVAMYFPINKPLSTAMSWMEKIVTEQEYTALVSHNSHAGWHARGPQLASALSEITSQKRAEAQGRWVTLASLMFCCTERWFKGPNSGCHTARPRQVDELPHLTENTHAQPGSLRRSKRCSAQCVTPRLTAVKNNCRCSDPIRPFSLAVDNPASQGSQIQAQHFSMQVTLSD